MKVIPAIGNDGYNDTATQNGFSRGVYTVSLRNQSAINDAGEYGRQTVSASGGFGDVAVNGFNVMVAVDFIHKDRSMVTGVTPQYFSGNTCHYGGTNFDNVASRSVTGAAPKATNGRDLYINCYPGCAVRA